MNPFKQHNEIYKTSKNNWNLTIIFQVVFFSKALAMYIQKLIWLLNIQLSCIKVSSASFLLARALIADTRTQFWLINAELFKLIQYFTLYSDHSFGHCGLIRNPIVTSHISDTFSCCGKSQVTSSSLIVVWRERERCQFCWFVMHVLKNKKNFLEKPKEKKMV